jgi:sigma-B regulation protein RsbU (phosphoserine phosphatase)
MAPSGASVPEKLQVLVVEDRAADAELMVKELQKAGFEVDWQRVETERELRFRLTPRLDVILTDYNLPGFGALPVLRLLREANLDIPILVVSGSLGDEKAAEVLTAGATDYILKDRMARLGPAVRRALQERRSRLAKLQAEEALRRSEAQMRGILSTIDDIVWSVSLPDLKVLYLNPAAERLLGRPVVEFLQNPKLWMECVHPDDRQRAFAAQEAALKWGTAEYEYRVIRLDGSVRNALMRCWVAYDEAGNATRLEGIIADVTEKRQAEEKRLELESSRREAERLTQVNAFKTQFIGMVAHDLNNVLTPMRLNLGVIRKKVPELPDAIRKPVDNLGSNLDRMSGFLADLLDASRLQSGHLALDLESFDLAEALRRTTDAFQPEADAARLAFSLAAPPTLAVTADRRRLEQVTTNLLSNALKFTPQGGSVTVKLEALQDEVRLSIKDTGPGVAAEDLAKLFRPFSRLQATPQGKHTGTGLGLYICRGIVEQHGGRIWCESEGAGKGACFNVLLPLGSPAEAGHASDATSL